HAIGNNLRHPPGLPQVRLEGAILQPPLDGHQPAFVEVAGAGFGEFAPCDDLEEVCLPLAMLVREGPVHGDAESGHRVALLRVAEFWIRRQAADKDDTVKHVITSSLYIRPRAWARS